jgi:hypothetical protein
MSSAPTDAIEQLRTIRAMMERSSRFISLSGWSGIAAGTIALIGAVLAYLCIENYYAHDYRNGGVPNQLFLQLVGIAIGIFVLAATFAIFFTIKKSKSQGIPIWGDISKRLVWNTLLPILVGGVIIIKMMYDNRFEYVAGSCLLFYGMGLVNGSKYTLGEVRYLGYTQLILGMIAFLWPTHGLLIWALGFGVAHIGYGLIMLRKENL